MNADEQMNGLVHHSLYNGILNSNQIKSITGKYNKTK